jgi:hypothetical protein
MIKRICRRQETTKMHFLFVGVLDNVIEVVGTEGVFLARFWGAISLNSGVGRT